MSSGLYFEGVVDTWCSGDRRNFGFISYTDAGRENRVFFPANSIRLDSLGRRGHVTFQNALVRFRVEKTTHKGQPRIIAADVHPVFIADDEQLSTSIEEQREVSQITAINSGNRSVWLVREDGSPMFLHLEQVIPDHVDRFLDVQVGDYVYHGIQLMESGKWGAVHAEIFSHEESDKLKCGESLDAEPQQPEPEPVSVVATSELEPLPAILAPQNPKTIAELIAERRLHG